MRKFVETALTLRRRAQPAKAAAERKRKAEKHAEWVLRRTPKASANEEE